MAPGTPPQGPGTVFLARQVCDESKAIWQQLGTGTLRYAPLPSSQDRKDDQKRKRLRKAAKAARKRNRR